jgi:arylsulfatase
MPRNSLLTGASALLLACGEPAPASDVPSVVLVSIDTLRADHLGLHGYPRDTSPFLDRWARSATVFERAYSPCPWTLPAHMTLLTGLYPPQHGVTAGDLALADEIPLLAERLDAAGFRTVGLYHPVWVHERHGFARGFDVFRPHADAAQAEEHLREELDELDPARPFFLFLHLFDVHVGPFRPGEHSIYPSPEPFQELFMPGATAKLPLVPQMLDPHDPLQREALAALYDGGIRHVDAVLGRCFGELERRGLLADGLVVVTADHGENLMERGRNSGHGHFWNEGIQVPLIVRHPAGLGAGERVVENVHLGDVVPTVLDVLGLPPDPRLPGLSLFGALPAERVILGSYEPREPRAYVLQGSRKIARGKNGGYLGGDLAADPLEKNGVRFEDGAQFDELYARAFDAGLPFPPPVRIEPPGDQEAEALRALGYAGELDEPEDE